jgi:hypothetical protein
MLIYFHVIVVPDLLLMQELKKYFAIKNQILMILNLEKDLKEH